MDTQVIKDELLGILRDNRGKHRAVFEAALEGYRQQAQETLELQLLALGEARTPEIRIVLSRPEDHTRDYDRIIKMLELDIREEITLSEREVARYVMDDWDWKRDFIRMSSQYAAASTQKAYGVIDDGDYA